jgi:tetrahydromethanopterin S-methyltransferase subunit B
MVEMLPLVKIAPELNLTLDPSSGVIGASLGREVLILSMDTINEQITELEAAANDIETALDPTTTSEGVYMTAGKLTNMVYGFVLGLILLVALLL